MQGEQAYVGEILVRHGIVDRDKLVELTQTAEERGLQIADVLVRTGAAEEEDVIKALADEMGMPFEAKLDQDIPEELLEEVPIGFARQHHLLPLREEAGQVVVAVADPLDPFSLDDLRARLGRPVVPVASTSEAIDDLINRVYERKDAADLGEKEEDEEDELEDLLDATDEAPVIRFVNNLFYTAQQERASDIHVEPTDDNVVVRYRIDGRLVQRKTAPKGALQSIVARIKIEAGLNIAEKRLPQDGRITKKIRGKVVDVRVSTIPTAKGERVVMRLLDKANIQLDLMDLGFARRELNIWSRSSSSARTASSSSRGPTGSGKTTTLYGSLNRINTPDQNILTAEDPGGVRAPGHRPAPGARQDRPHLRRRAPELPPPGPGRDHGRRDSRPRDRRARHPGLAHGPPGALDAAHERRAGRHHAPRRHEGAALSNQLDGARRARPAPRAAPLPASAASPTRPLWRTSSSSVSRWRISRRP